MLYGTLAEIFARQGGLQPGPGRLDARLLRPLRQHAQQRHRRRLGRLSPMGSALFKRINRKPGIVIANIGDASMGCGPVWEAMMFAAMDQYRQLWPGGSAATPPILFNFFNNFYGMGGQTDGETMGYEHAGPRRRRRESRRHARRAGGRLQPAGGGRRDRPQEEDPPGRARARCCWTRSPTGSPGTPRRMPPPTAPRRRSRLWEDARLRSAASPTLPGRQQGASPTDRRATTWTPGSSSSSPQVLELAVQRRALSAGRTPRFIESVMFTNGNVESVRTTGSRSVLQPLAENPRVKAIARQEPLRPRRRRASRSPRPRCTVPRRPVRGHGPPLLRSTRPWCACGEENRDWGGAFAVYRGLTEVLPYHRLFNSPDLRRRPSSAPASATPSPAAGRWSS